jgi:hypothetical protein
MSEDSKAKETQTEEVTKKEETTKPEETKPEETKPEVVKKPKSEMNIVEVISDFLKSKDNTQITLTPEMRKTFRRLASKKLVDKSSVEKIETFFNEIIKDKKIDVKDIPSIIGLMKELYALYESQKMKITSEDVGFILKTCVKLLIIYKCENNPDIGLKVKSAILKNMDTIIDAAVEMIEYKDLQKKLKSVFRFIPCM